MGKKKKRAEREAESELLNTETINEQNDLHLVNGDSKKIKKKKTKEVKEESVLKEKPTVSIALAGSIIDNTQSLELATRLAGQIARASTIFRIDEVVVFDNIGNSVDCSDPTMEDGSHDDESGAAFLFRILKYMETPQYLRKSLFPMHNNLRYVGSLPPLDAPHHLRKHEWAPYREGVTLKDRNSTSGGTLVDVGLSKPVAVDQVIAPGIRVTVSMGAERNLDTDDCVDNTAATRDEVSEIRGKVRTFGEDVQSVHLVVQSLETKISRIEGRQNETNYGVGKLLSFMRSIETRRPKEQIEAPPSSSSRPALELPSVASSARAGSLPPSLSVESSSPSASSVSPKRPLHGAVSASGLKELGGISDVVEVSNESSPQVSNAVFTSEQRSNENSGFGSVYGRKFAGVGASFLTRSRSAMQSFK